MTSPRYKASQLRKWSRDCSGHEPSLSCLQRACDDAADLIETTWRIAKAAVFVLPFGIAAACYLWFGQPFWEGVWQGYKTVVTFAGAVILFGIFYEIRDALVARWRATREERHSVDLDI